MLNSPREVEAGIQHVTGYFSSHPQLVSRAHEYDFDQLVNELNLAVHDFNARGSSFVFNIVKRFIVVITQYRPLSGSSYPHTSLNREKEGNNQRH